MQAFRKSLLVALTLAALLSACAPAAPGPQQVRAQIETSVVMTVAAQNQMGTFVAQTVQAQLPAATATSTPTLIAIPSLTPILPSATGFVVAPPSSGGGGGGGGGGGSKSGCADKQRCCAVVGQVPGDWPDRHAILKTGDPLDVRWTIKNIGTKTWEPAWSWSYFTTSVDTNVPSNTSLTTSSTSSQSTLGVSVPPGDYITLGIELNAPASFEGRDPIKIMTQWAIKGDGARFCKPYIYIEVIRPGMTP